MPSNRFFTSLSLDEKIPVLLEGNEHHHLVHVMRFCVNDEIELVNGRGELAKGRIESIHKNRAVVRVLSVDRAASEEILFFLAVPMLRLSKLELIIEKGTELGANGFLIFPADYSEKEEISSRQLERLHLVSIAALKQCGRLFFPSITYTPDLKSLFSENAQFIFGDTRDTEGILAHNFQNSKIIFISGPEKGFSPAEIRLLEQKAKGVRLNSNILKAETAPIAAASLLAAKKTTHSNHTK